MRNCQPGTRSGAWPPPRGPGAGDADQTTSSGKRLARRWSTCVKLGGTVAVVKPGLSSRSRLLRPSRQTRPPPLIVRDQVAAGGSRQSRSGLERNALYPGHVASAAVGYTKPINGIAVIGLFRCRLVSSFAQTPQCEAPTNEADERAAPPRSGAPSDRRTKNHASSINSSGRVAELVLLQGVAIGAIASMVIGFSWGGWMLGSTANRHAAEQASTAVVQFPHADLRGEVPAERRCASKSGSPARNLFQLATGPVLGEGRLGDTAGGYVLRLRAGQGVCSEIDRSPSCIPMRSVAPGGSVNIGNMF